MKNTYIAIIAVVVMGGGLWFFMGSNNKAVAPTPVENTQTNNNNLNTIEVGLEEKPIQNANVVTPITNKATVKEFTISGKNFSFTPNMITVKKGDRVKITFLNTNGFHDFRIEEFGVATTQFKSPGQEVLEFVADKTGSFQYYCSVGSHMSMGMYGTLKVE